MKSWNGWFKKNGELYFKKMVILLPLQAAV